MSASDSQVLLAARSIAVVGLGLNAGLMLSIPALSIPALKATTSLSAQQRLTLWSNLYEQGKAVMMKLQPTLTLLLAYASYAAARPVDYLPANTVARYRKGRRNHAMTRHEFAADFAFPPLLLGVRHAAHPRRRFRPHNQHCRVHGRRDHAAQQAHAEVGARGERRLDRPSRLAHRPVGPPPRRPHRARHDCLCARRFGTRLGLKVAAS